MSYILWVHYPYEGWSKYDCDTIEECYKEAVGMAATDFLITPPAIDVDFSERT